MRSIALSAALLLAVAAACAPTPEEAPQTTPIYARFAQLQADPAFAAKLAEPAERIHAFDWMLGAWRTTVTVEGQAGEDGGVTTFRRQGDSLIVADDLTTVMGYDAFAQRWFSADFEPPAAPVSQAFSARDWDGRQIVFDADVRIFGERFILRQTLTKLGDDAFEIVNEQQVAPGRYQRVDAYRYARVAPSPAASP